MASEDEFLAARAEASVITVATAIEAVELVTGSPPRSVERFRGSWGAVPFWVTADDGRLLVVRAGVEERPYEQEGHVLRWLAACGIPVPEVVGVTRVAGRPVSVLERLPGRSLQDHVARRGWTDELQGCAVAAGELLARVHGLGAPAFGLPEPPSIATRLERIRRGVDPTAWHLVAEAAARTEVLATPVPPTLVHWDFGADHVLVDGGRITGVIDWEWALVGDPASDLAWWRLYEADMGGGAEHVAHGYGDHDEERVVAWMFARCLDGLAFHLEVGHVGGVEDDLRHLEVLLAS